MSVARRVASGTTRLILIAIVVGGLLSVALNLWEPGYGGGHDHLIVTGSVAPIDEALRNEFPIGREIVRGNAASARDVVVRRCRESLSTDEVPTNDMPAPGDAPAISQEYFQNTTELARAENGQWSIHQLADLPQRIIGVRWTSPEPTIRCWGGYDETGPGQWTIWTMRLPLPQE